MSTSPFELPAITLITISYNSDKTIADTFRSIRDQGYPKLQYVVVDGGSRDGTLELIRQNEDLITDWVSEADKGIYDAMNKGLGRATGEWVGIVNSDDYLEPGALAAVAEAAHAHPEADLIVGNIHVLLDEAGAIRYVQRPRTDAVESRFHSMPLPHPATFVRRRVYEELGGFDLNYRVAADYEFIMRCMKAGKRFVFIDRVLSNFRAGGTSGSAFMRTTREERDIKLAYGGNKLLAWAVFLRASFSYFVVSRLGRFPGFQRLYRALKAAP